MDLRRCSTQSLATAGALLMVAGLSLGGGVALAEPGPAAAGQPDAVKATNTSSDKSSDKPNKKDRKSKKSTSTTSSDSTGSGSGTSDSSGPDSTATTASTTPPSTASPSTTVTIATTSTTRPTTTSAPATTATTAAVSDSTGNGSGGTYDGKPISATEDDDSTTTTIDDGRGTSTPAGKKPAARGGAGGGGSDLPPGIYPADPGPGGARTANSPAPSSANSPAAPVLPNPPIVVTETQPAQATSSTTATAAEGGTATDPDSEVRGANQVQEEAPAPARRARQLGQTGDGTRRLILFGGVALLIGAVVVGFTGRDGPILAAAAALPAGPVRRRKPRRELDGWEDGVPLAPTKRELARQRLGLSADVWYYDDEPGA